MESREQLPGRSSLKPLEQQDPFLSHHLDELRERSQLPRLGYIYKIYGDK
jgi:hypothetical protein